MCCTIATQLFIMAIGEYQSINLLLQPARLSHKAKHAYLSARCYHFDMPKIQLWKINDEGLQEEIMIPTKPSTPRPRVLENPREKETLARLRRVCSSAKDIDKFIQMEWKLLFSKGFRATSDLMAPKDFKIPKLVSVNSSFTSFNDLPAHKIAPRGRPTNWGGYDKTIPSKYLGYTMVTELITESDITIPFSLIFQDTGINVTAIITNRERKINEPLNFLVRSVLFLEDWPEIEKAAAVGRLSGDDILIERYYSLNNK